MPIYDVPVGRFTVRITNSSPASACACELLDAGATRIPVPRGADVFEVLTQAEKLEAAAKRKDEINGLWDQLITQIDSYCPMALVARARQLRDIIEAEEKLRR